MAEREDDPDPPRAGRRPPAPGPAGLCPDCRHVKIVTSERGSTFLLCRKAAVDPRFPRYPPQPIVSCPGFAR
jgi:hypothetical protein